MGPKKKLTKKEKAKLEAELAETQRIELEKERLRKFEEERDRKVLEREEAKRRQKQEIQENKTRRIQLQESCQHFTDVEHEIQKIYEKIRKQKEWSRYMRCNGLPDSYNPGDLRKYLHMWSRHVTNENKQERNWLLKTDERTVLTQDHTVKNMTKIHLKSQQKNLGDIYASRIREVLGILGDLDEATNDHYLLSSFIIKDLHKLKYEIRFFLANYIDEFSFKILSNINRDMQLDATVNARHLYESDVLKSQIWTIRDIPQPPMNPKEKLKAETSRTEIDFAALGINMTLPPSIKCINSAMRALWLNYDHFSDYCTSFIIPFQQKVMDINLSTKIEWRKRKEILSDLLNSFQDDGQLNVKLSGDVGQDDNVKDVDKIYAQYEDNLNKNTKLRKGPEALNLDKFDVNLRSHRIVGGVYSIDFFEQPHQDSKLITKSFLRTVTYPNKLKRIPFCQSYKPPEPVLPGMRRLPEEIEAEMRETEKNLDKLLAITIKLPEDVIWFEPPIVCRWEVMAETKYFNELNKRDCHQKQKHNIKSRDNLKNSTKIVEDFDLFNLPPGTDLYCLLQEFVIPRIPDGYTFDIGELQLNRKNSILKYINKDDETDTNGHPIPSLKSVNVKDVLKCTKSPRPLYPKIIIKRSLEVVNEIERSYESEILEKYKKLQPIINTISSNKPSDNSSHSSSTVTSLASKFTTNRTTSIYMFSQLLKDLDYLCEQQIPITEKPLEEDTSDMSSRNEEEFDDIETELEFTSMSLQKFADLPFPSSFFKIDVVEEIEKIEEEPESDDSTIDMEVNDGVYAVEYINSCQKIDDELIGKWTTRDVHDVKFNEEKLAIQFRAGQFGYFGLAINWYSNLPYQTWELKPDQKIPGNVIFSVTAAVISIEITISNDGVKLNAFQGAMSNIVQDSVGILMSFEKFKTMLTSVAINIFPDDDAFCYAEGTCEKNYAMESHLYKCMADISLTHNFSWSRWNLLSGSRSAVLLLREIIEQRKVPHFSTLLVTPMKATIVDCIEVSPNFCSTSIAGMDFYADLYHLVQVHSQGVSKRKQLSMNPLIRDNVLKVLTSVRPLSFC